MGANQEKENKQVEIATKFGNAVIQGIENNSPTQTAEAITRICDTTVVLSYPFAEPIVNFFKQERRVNFGSNFAEKAKGKVYFKKWEPKTPVEKTIVPSCSATGQGVTINAINCCTCGDCQVPKDFEDLVKVEKNQLCAFISEDELRSQSCGIDTYNNLLSLSNDQIAQSRNELPYDCILSLLNNPVNYSIPEGVTVSYCCDKCDGRNLMQAIKGVAKQMRNDASEYNKDGRVYRVPLSQQVLIVSDQVGDRISTILGNTFNTNFDNIKGLFAGYFEIPLKGMDFILLDRNALRFYEGLDRTRTKEDFDNRGYCVFVDYDYALKLISFRAAVYGKLNKVDCATAEAVTQFIQKIQIDNEPVEADTQPEAETAIKAKVDALNPLKDKIDTTITYSKFVAPTADANGSIEAKIVMKDKLGNELDSVVKVYTLKKK